MPVASNGRTLLQTCLRRIGDGECAARPSPALLLELHTYREPAVDRRTRCYVVVIVRVGKIVLVEQIFHVELKLDIVRGIEEQRGVHAGKGGQGRPGAPSAGEKD